MSFFYAKMQHFVADQFFPPGNGDWYTLQGYNKEAAEGEPVQTPFEQFMAAQMFSRSASYYYQFQKLNLNLERIKSTLINGEPCDIELLHCFALDELFRGKILAGRGKHIVYFTGMRTLYQNCFTDISTAAKKTGATIHAFNYPGVSSSTGRIRDVKDMINAGIAVVSALLIKGVHPDCIILQGDSFGAAIAYEVKKEFKIQSNIDLRIIMNNTFKSFKSVVDDVYLHTQCLSRLLKPNLKKLLIFTGWEVAAGKDYKFAGPYQCHIQHEGDKTLSASTTLSSKVEKYTIEARTGVSNSKKRAAYQDNCPAEYLESRNKLDEKHCVQLTAKAKKRIAKTYGEDKDGQVDAHYANLCELEMRVGGGSVYTHFICEFIEASDRYINNGHQQVFDRYNATLPLPLSTSGRIINPPTQEQAKEMLAVVDSVQGRKEAPRYDLEHKMYGP